MKTKKAVKFISEEMEISKESAREIYNDRFSHLDDIHMLETEFYDSYHGIFDSEAEFAEHLSNEYSLDFNSEDIWMSTVISAIDWQKVWDSLLRFDTNTYLLDNQKYACFNAN